MEDDAAAAAAAAEAAAKASRARFADAAAARAAAFSDAQVATFSKQHLKRLRLELQGYGNFGAAAGLDARWRRLTSAAQRAAAPRPAGASAGAALTSAAAYSDADLLRIPTKTALAAAKKLLPYGQRRVLEQRWNALRFPHRYGALGAPGASSSMVVAAAGGGGGGGDSDDGSDDSGGEDGSGGRRSAGGEGAGAGAGAGSSNGGGGGGGGSSAAGAPEPLPELPQQEDEEEQEQLETYHMYTPAKLTYGRPHPTPCVAAAAVGASAARRSRLPAYPTHHTPSTLPPTRPPARSIVETKALASVAPPDIHYTPALPWRMVAGGFVSSAQLETVVYASQRHTQFLVRARRSGGR